MKILLTTDWYVPVINGVVTSVLLLKRELEKRGHEVRVVTLSDDIHSYKEGDTYYIGSVSAGKIYPEARLRMRRTGSLMKELMEWRPDIVHSQCEFSTFLPAYRVSVRLDIPLVHTYHTVYEDYTHYLHMGVRMGKRLVSTFSRELGNRTGCLVAPSKKVEELLRNYGIDSRIEVIPTGVDLSAFQKEPTKARLTQLRRQWQIPEDKTVLLYLGRMAKEKNLEQMVDRLADSGRKDYVLLLVGDGPCRQEVLGHARRRGVPVIYTGMVPHQEVPDYYRLGDLFVTASTSETQGLTYFEALASALPVLCCQDPCVDGVVIDGVNGWQYRDEADFVRCLDIFCSDPLLRSRLSKQAAETAERFSGERFGDAVEQLYLSLLKK